MTRAEIKENVLVAVDTLRTRKVRSGLTILGIVIGLMVGIGLAFFIEYLDTSVKTIDDVERAARVEVRVVGRIVGQRLGGRAGVAPAAANHSDLDDVAARSMCTAAEVECADGRR